MRGCESTANGSGESVYVSARGLVLPVFEGGVRKRETASSARKLVQSTDKSSQEETRKLLV